MLSLILAGAFFVGIHVFVSGTTLRDRIVERITEQGFLGFFSLLSLAAISWMISAYRGAPFILLWAPQAWFTPVAMGLVLIAALLVIPGLLTPNPTSVGGEGSLARSDEPRGMLRVTRHPFLWGVAIWAVSHLIANGDAASVVLFGALAALALIGPFLIDRKRRRRMGAEWDEFAGKTSNVPFGAILSGRNTLMVSELNPLAFVAAFAIYAAVLVWHGNLFGPELLPGSR